jgi:hypothetical protein
MHLHFLTEMWKYLNESIIHSEKKNRQKQKTGLEKRSMSR